MKYIMFRFYSNGDYEVDDHAKLTTLLIKQINHNADNKKYPTLSQEEEGYISAYIFKKEKQEYFLNLELLKKLQECTLHDGGYFILVFKDNKQRIYSAESLSTLCKFKVYDNWNNEIDAYDIHMNARVKLNFFKSHIPNVKNELTEFCQVNTNLAEIVNALSEWQFRDAIQKLITFGKAIKESRAKLTAQSVFHARNVLKTVEGIETALDNNEMVNLHQMVKGLNKIQESLESCRYYIEDLSKQYAHVDPSASYLLDPKLEKCLAIIEEIKQYYQEIPLESLKENLQKVLARGEYLDVGIRFR